MYTLGSLSFPPSHVLGAVQTCCSWRELQQLSETRPTTSWKSSGCALLGIGGAGGDGSDATTVCVPSRPDVSDSL